MESNNSNGEDPQSLDELEQSLEAAMMAPSSKSIEAFYRSFLTARLFVPERYQSNQPNNLSDFSSPFLDVLALKAGDTNYIPVFTSETELRDWSEEDLSFLRLTGEEVCKRAPEHWWLTLNPAGEFGKEISDWEIERLRSGTEALAELVAEQLQGEDSPVSFSALSEQEATRLSSELQPLLKRYPALEAVHIGIHSRESESDRYIVGIVMPERAQTAEAREDIENALTKIFIGDIPLEVHFGSVLDSSPALSLFRFSPPIAVQEKKSETKKLIQRLRNFLTLTP